MKHVKWLWQHNPNNPAFMKAVVRYNKSQSQYKIVGIKLCYWDNWDWDKKWFLVWSFHLTEDSVYRFHYGTVRLVLMNGLRSPGMVSSTDWPPTSSTHQSAHPESAFDSGLFRNAAVHFLHRIWDFPHWRPSNMSVNHASVVELWERLSCGLWCDSHRTCIWTTPILVDKQMIQ